MYNKENMLKAKIRFLTNQSSHKVEQLTTIERGMFSTLRTKLYDCTVRI